MRWLIFLPARVVGILARWGWAGVLWLGLGVALYLLLGDRL